MKFKPGDLLVDQESARNPYLLVVSINKRFGTYIVLYCYGNMQYNNVEHGCGYIEHFYKLCTDVFRELYEV